MRFRTLKLREAHKNADKVGSFCSIIWDNRAHHLVTSSSSDPTILIHDSLLLSSTPKSIRHHHEGVTALALSPNSTCLASSSKDRSVKLYKFPSGEFETNITRFTLPIRAICFNSSGSTLAAAGDDEGIKLINAIDGSIARVLKGHHGSVTGLAFDPNGEYMASVDSIGTVIFWELNSGKALHVLTSIAPNVGSNVSISNAIRWSPDGEMLAVPGLRNDVVMYDRDTAEKLFTLRGDHLEPVCSISWSLNGKYIASSSLDKQVLVWDVEQRQDIDKQRFDDVICSMAWKPIGNSLAVIDVKGRFCVWEAPVPPSMKSPTEDLPSNLKNNNGLLLFDEENNEPSVSGSLSDIGKGSNGVSDPPIRKRLKKSLNYDDESSDENIDPKPKSTVKHGNGVSPTDRKNTATSKERNVKSIIQEAFQPGATPKQTGKCHFLCYNMFGSITSIEYDGYCHIEIDFHDTGRGPRVPSMTDYFGFTMASMNEKGSVFANPCKGEKNMSSLMYRPFSSWANNSEWSMRFEEEEVRAVMLGSGWVAAATSFNYLRIFTEGGLQKHVISLNGPVVTTSGINDKLAIVSHASTSLPPNEQILEFQVLNICEKTLMFRGHLPLTPGSKLTWLGFSEEGDLSSYDSKGVLRVYSNQFGGTWLPLFRVAKSGENYWVVGVGENKLYCIACQSPDLFPQVLPKPVLSLLDFSFPLPSSDLGAEALENEFIMKNMQLSRIHENIENLVAAGTDTAAADDKAFNVEAALDRCILRLIASCCNGDKLVRASELVRFLSLEKSIRGAIKLATALKLPNLAERFNDILEERISRDSTICEAVPHEIPACDMSTKADVHNKILPSIDSDQTLRLLPPSSTPKLTSPSFVKKRSAPEGDSMEVKHTQNGALDDIEGKRIEKAKKPCEGGSKEAKKPSNPFAKSSTSHDKSSLFESIKKMKGVDSTEKNR